MKPYWTVPDAAKSWNLSPVRVREFLQAKRVPGARQVNNNGHIEWRIPIDAPKPEPGRPGPKPKAE